MSEDRTVYHPNGQKLHCYASGSGGLSFSWIDRNGNCDGTKVLEEHVLSLLSKEFYRERYEGWMVAKVNSQWQLFPVYQRVEQSKNPKVKGTFRRFYSDREKQYSSIAPCGYSDFRYEKFNFELFPEIYTSANTNLEIKLEDGWHPVAATSSAMYWLNHEDQIMSVETSYMINAQHEILSADPTLEANDQIKVDGGWETISSNEVGTITKLSGQYRREITEPFTKNELVAA